MKKAFYLIFLILCLSFLGSAQPSTDREKILAVLSAQQTAWNNGDMVTFMEGYWKSDSLKFIGKKGLTYGWQQTLENYKKGYPDIATMGKLSFNILTIEIFSDTAAYVIGKWDLKREKGDVGGHFTLLFRKITREWKIVADHSS